MRKRKAELWVGILLGITGMLLAVVAAAAQDSAPSPYPRFIKGEEFFIPGKPLVVYLTVQPRFTAIEHDSRNRIINDFFSWRRIKLQKREIRNDTFILQLQFFFGYPHNPRLENWDFLCLSAR